MSDLGIKTKLGFRLCDWSGNTIVEPLPHLNQSVWNINGMQPGQAGSVGISSFSVPLHPPRSDEFKNYKGIYSKINYAQRIEAYILGESGEYALGIPVWSGLITHIDKQLDKYLIAGFDTTWLANQQIFYPGQKFSDLTGEAGFGQGVSALLSQYYPIENLVFIDDFGGNRYPSYATAWTSIIGATWTTSTDDGLSGLLSPVDVTSESTMMACAASSGTGSTAKILPSVASESTTYTAWFHIFNPSINNGSAIDAGIIFGSNALDNDGWLANVRLIGNGTTYDVHAQIFVKTAGTYSAALVDTTPFTALKGDRKFQLIVLVEGGATNPTSTIRVLVNGKDSNCTISMSGQVKEPGPNFGVRYNGNTGSGGQKAFMTKFYIKKRAISWPGTDYPQPIQPFITTGGPIAGGNTGFTDLSVNGLSINGLNELDLWSIGASSDGLVWRKDAQRFTVQPAFTRLIGDLINYGVQGSANGFGTVGAGVDLTKQIILDETTNIVSGGATANGDHMASEVAFGFTANTDGDGRVNWPDTPGILNLGQGPGNLAPPLIVTDIVNIAGLSDMLLARRMVENVSAQKALTVGQAKTFTILRTPELAQPRLETIWSIFADFRGNRFQALSPQAFRELDFVTLNCPSLDINMAKVSVIGYTFREGDPTFDVILDQHPTDSKIIVDRRRWGSLDSIMLLYATRT